jgi:hypothetical protein
MCDSFMDLYSNQEYMKTIPQSDFRAQLEVYHKKKKKFKN